MNTHNAELEPQNRILSSNYHAERRQKKSNWEYWPRPAARPQKAYGGQGGKETEPGDVPGFQLPCVYDVKIHSAVLILISIDRTAIGNNADRIELAFAAHTRAPQPHFWTVPVSLPCKFWCAATTLLVKWCLPSGNLWLAAQIEGLLDFFRISHYLKALLQPSPSINYHTWWSFLYQKSCCNGKKQKIINWEALWRLKEHHV